MRGDTYANAGYTPLQLAEDFLYYHLDCARRARMQANRMGPSDPDLLSQRTFREMALRKAGVLVDSLRRMKYPLSAEIKALMDTEVLV